jgi:hypothetical protein
VVISFHSAPYLFPLTSFIMLNYHLRLGFRPFFPLCRGVFRFSFYSTCCLSSEFLLAMFICCFLPCLLVSLPIASSYGMSHFSSYSLFRSVYPFLDLSASLYIVFHVVLTAVLYCDIFPFCPGFHLSLIPCCLTVLQFLIRGSCNTDIVNNCVNINGLTEAVYRRVTQSLTTLH